MTKPKDLRDEFAIAALDTAAKDVLENYSRGSFRSSTGEVLSSAAAISVVAYEIANAMMAEREKKA